MAGDRWRGMRISLFTFARNKRKFLWFHMVCRDKKSGKHAINQVRSKQTVNDNNLFRGNEQGMKIKEEFIKNNVIIKQNLRHICKEFFSFFPSWSSEGIPII